MTQLKYGLFLGLVGAICTILLAATHYVTAPIIRANQEAAIRAAIDEAFPGFAEFTTIMSLENGDEISEPYILEVQRIYDSAGGTMGFIYTSSVNGFAGPILHIVGVNTDATFASFAVISHGETPGFGTFIEDAEFEELVQGLAPGATIDIRTGATGTSGGIQRSLSAIGRHFQTVGGN